MNAESANDRQVDGTHYKDLAKGGEQHWDMMWRLYREAWFVGAITKYLLRYRKKNGIKDLEKAQHYLQKLIELERGAADEAAKQPPVATIDQKKLNDELARIEAMKRPMACGGVTGYDAVHIEQDGHGFGHCDFRGGSE